MEDWVAEGMSGDTAESWLEEFVDLNESRVMPYQMENGRLYWFHDPRRYHNLYNVDSQPHYTLAMDLLENDWLRSTSPELQG